MPTTAQDDAAFSNPVAPPNEAPPEDSKSVKNLTNADFRKLMMTPRTSSAPAKESSKESSSAPEEAKTKTEATKDTKEDIRASERRKRKSYYAKLKKEDEAKMAELAKKYRDRALERRDNKNPDYQAGEEPSTEAQGAYRAVAPDLKSVLDAAERRKQVIQESKFLGGDMEHTHLVKGLDYALLQKVRSEIVMVEAAQTTEEPEQGGDEEEAQAPTERARVAFTSDAGRRIFNTLFRSGPDFNDLFLPGRMAYSIDLEADDDLPTTVIRSKADLQGIENMQATFSSNDMVIQKLSQIFSYLRTGRTSKKIKKKDHKKTDSKMDDSIYGDIGSYVPTYNKPEKDKRDRHDRSDKARGSYFNKRDEKRDESRGERRVETWRELEDKREPEPRKERVEQVPVPQPVKEVKKPREDNFYTECYPDMAEMHDAIEDSDEEADYTKMDLGNRKGPIGRWDFETTEEYSNYMNQKEALPKAAFQYGVKMADGRKTRRIPGNKEKDRNAELSREWQQIQAIIKKRKVDDIPPPEKRQKY